MIIIKKHFEYIGIFVVILLFAMFLSLLIFILYNIQFNLDHLSTYLYNNIIVIIGCLSCLLFGIYLIYLLLYNRYAKPKKVKLLLINNKNGVLEFSDNKRKYYYISNKKYKINSYYYVLKTKYEIRQVLERI